MAESYTGTFNFFPIGTFGFILWKTLKARSLPFYLCVMKYSHTIYNSHYLSPEPRHYPELESYPLSNDYPFSLLSVPGLITSAMTSASVSLASPGTAGKWRCAMNVIFALGLFCSAHCFQHSSLV